MTDCVSCEMPDGDHDFACPFHEWNLWKLPHEYDRDAGVVFDQCPITMRRCDRPCGVECIRGMFAALRTDAAVGR